MMYRNALVFCALLLPATAVADDDSVYESLAGVDIGRVFLSQQQRDALDARRGDDDLTNASGEASATAAPPKSRSSAGYIIGRGGRSKVWKDGDFVDETGVSSIPVTFPGDVKITHHLAGVADDRHDDAASGDESEMQGARDD